MKRIIFTVATRSGKFDYYDDNTYTYRDGSQRYYWRVQDGKVEWLISKEKHWVVDVKSVQDAYQKYIARLIIS